MKPDRYRGVKTCARAGAYKKCSEPGMGGDAGGQWAGPNLPDFEDGDPVYVVVAAPRMRFHLTTRRVCVVFSFRIAGSLPF